MRGLQDDPEPVVPQRGCDGQSKALGLPRGPPWGSGESWSPHLLQTTVHSPRPRATALPDPRVGQCGLQGVLGGLASVRKGSGAQEEVLHLGAPLGTCPPHSHMSQPLANIPSWSSGLPPPGALVDLGPPLGTFHP